MNVKGIGKTLGTNIKAPKAPSAVGKNSVFKSKRAPAVSGMKATKGGVNLNSGLPGNSVSIKSASEDTHNMLKKAGYEDAKLEQYRKALGGSDRAIRADPKKGRLIDELLAKGPLDTGDGTDNFVKDTFSRAGEREHAAKKRLIVPVRRAVEAGVRPGVGGASDFYRLPKADPNIKVNTSTILHEMGHSMDPKFRDNFAKHRMNIGYNPKIFMLAPLMGGAVLGRGIQGVTKGDNDLTDKIQVGAGTAGVGLGAAGIYERNRAENQANVGARKLNTTADKKYKMTPRSLDKRLSLAKGSYNRVARQLTGMTLGIGALGYGAKTWKQRREENKITESNKVASARGQFLVTGLTALAGGSLGSGLYHATNRAAPEEEQSPGLHQLRGAVGGAAGAVGLGGLASVAKFIDKFGPQSNEPVKHVTSKKWLRRGAGIAAIPLGYFGAGVLADLNYNREKKKIASIIGEAVKDMKHPLSIGFGAMEYVSGTNSLGGTLGGVGGASLGYSAASKGMDSLGNKMSKSNNGFLKRLGGKHWAARAVRAIPKLIGGVVGYSPGSHIGNKVPIHKRQVGASAPKVPVSQPAKDSISRGHFAPPKIAARWPFKKRLPKAKVKAEPTRARKVFNTTAALGGGAALGELTHRQAERDAVSPTIDQGTIMAFKGARR